MSLLGCLAPSPSMPVTGDIWALQGYQPLQTAGGELNTYTLQATPPFDVGGWRYLNSGDGGSSWSDRWRALFNGGANGTVWRYFAFATTNNDSLDDNWTILYGHARGLANRATGDLRLVLYESGANAIIHVEQYDGAAWNSIGAGTANISLASTAIHYLIWGVAVPSSGNGTSSIWLDGSGTPDINAAPHTYAPRVTGTPAVQLSRVGGKGGGTYLGFEWFEVFGNDDYDDGQGYNARLPYSSASSDWHVWTAVPRGDVLTQWTNTPNNNNEHWRNLDDLFDNDDKANDEVTLGAGTNQDDAYTLNTYSGGAVVGGFTFAAICGINLSSEPNSFIVRVPTDGAGWTAYTATTIESYQVWAVATFLNLRPGQTGASGGWATLSKFNEVQVGVRATYADVTKEVYMLYVMVLGKGLARPANASAPTAASRSFAAVI